MTLEQNNHAQNAGARLIGMLRTQNPLRRAIERQRQRHGSSRVNVTIAWACITITAVALVFITNQYIRQWAGGLMSPAAAEEIAGLMLWIGQAIVITISGAAYFVLIYGLVKPVQDYRSRVKDQIHSAVDERDGTIAKLAYEHRQRGQHLQAALADNKNFRQRLTELQAIHANSDALVKSLFDASTERLVLVGASGVVVEISQPLATTIGVQRGGAVGHRFDELFKLYDPLRDNPLEYPLRGLAAELIEQRSSIPKLSQVQLMTAGQRPENCLMSGTAVLGPSGQMLGALLRFETERAGEGSGAGGAAARKENAAGLPGRTLFERRLKELIEIARTQNTRHTLLLLEVDNLRRIKDSFGQRASNELFWSVAQIAKNQTGARGTCYVASPESIGILLLSTDAAAARTLAESLRAAVAGHTFTWQEARYESSLSIGAIEIGPHSDGPAALMDHAASAALRARNEGGFHAHAEGEADVKQRHSDQEWIAWLMPRLKDGFGHVISQTIVPLSGSGARKPLFEVFLRIQDDDGAWLPPGAFMPAIERHELGVLVDLWVLDTVLAQLRAAPQILEQHDCASLNLSAAALEDPDFAQRAMAAIRAAGLPPGSICFEIGESLALSRQSAMSRFVQSAKGAGARIALDRYRAAGGLQTLRELPLDYVKIHDSLLRNLAGAQPNSLDRLHLTWVNEVCHAAQLATIAMNVDDESLLATLKAVGIDYGQGTAINKLGPMLT